MVLLDHHGGPRVMMDQDLLTITLVAGMIDLAMLGHLGKVYFRFFVAESSRNM